MCMGGSKSNTTPPEPTPPTTFSYRAGADSLKKQQQGVATGQITAPPTLGSELGSSDTTYGRTGRGFGDVNYGAGGA